MKTTPSTSQEDVEEVLQDDNVPGRGIEKLTISVVTSDTAEQETHPRWSDRNVIAQAVFSRSPKAEDGCTVALELAESDRDWCLLLADELDTQINRLFSGWPFTRRTGKTADVVVAGAFAGLMLALFMWLRQAAGDSKALPVAEVNRINVKECVARLLRDEADSTAFLPYFRPLSLAMLAALVTMSLRPFSRLMDKAARGVFYWGDMMAVHNRAQKLRSNWTWGIGVALVVSVVASLAVWYLTRR